jgi:hypothetical protein
MSKSKDMNSWKNGTVEITALLATEKGKFIALYNVT